MVFPPGINLVERRTAVKQDQDLRNIITSHQAEMTELELDIARYFLSPEAQQHSLSSSRVTQLLHVSKAALTRFLKNVASLVIVSLSTTLTKKLNQKN